MEGGHLLPGTPKKGIIDSVREIAISAPLYKNVPACLLEKVGLISASQYITPCQPRREDYTHHEVSLDDCGRLRPHRCNISSPDGT